MKTIILPQVRNDAQPALGYYSVFLSFLIYTETIRYFEKKILWGLILTHWATIVPNREKIFSQLLRYSASAELCPTGVLSRIFAIFQFVQKLLEILKPNL